MFNVRTAFRDFKRLKHITAVLFKEGMGVYVHKLKLKHHLFLDVKDRNKQLEEPKNIPENLRRAMDELGPTFVKLGQLLSLRQDLIPEEYCIEFSKLQDNVSEIPFRTIKKIVEKELKLKLDEMFSYFKEEPIASASIGQVHKAKLLNGEVVVVKIQRPNVEETIETDIEILYSLAELAKKYVDELKTYNLEELLKEFERYTKNELDYMKEGRNIDNFYENFLNDEDLIIPKVYWDFTTSKVLTMSYVQGVNIDEKELIKEKEYDINIISGKLADSFLKQVFEFGFFHADPHPGNVFVGKHGKIILLDYGIVGRLNEENKEKLIQILMKLVEKDFEGVLNGFLDLGFLPAGDNTLFKKELSSLIEEFAGTSINQVNVPKLFREFLNISQKHKFNIPQDYVLLSKAIITIEGVGQNIDPSFNLSKKLAEYAEELNLGRIGFDYFVKNTWKNFKNYKDTLINFPKQTSEILDRLKKGDLNVEFKHKDLDLLEKEIDRGSNRIALSVLVAALILASSLILNLEGSKGLAVLGFVLALILSLFLSISIYKERNIKV